MGGNVQATRYSGINVRRNLALVFMLNGLLAAIAAILYSARLNAATPTAGQNMELDAIAAAVIGGASLSGASGQVAGALLGGVHLCRFASVEPSGVDRGLSLR
jgi:D-xylose transport system permease protein